MPEVPGDQIPAYLAKKKLGTRFLATAEKMISTSGLELPTKNFKNLVKTLNSNYKCLDCELPIHPKLNYNLTEGL